MRKIEGKALLRRSVEVVLASNVDECFVVLNELSSARAQELDGMPLHLVEAKDAADGMAVSLV